MKALVTGDKGSSLLSSVLVILLQILLQDLQGDKVRPHSKKRTQVTASLNFEDVEILMFSALLATCIGDLAVESP
jgi:hypothetical protein